MNVGSMTGLVAAAVLFSAMFVPWWVAGRTKVAS